MSTGGTSIDRTMEAHPDNIEIAETAARVVGLDIAGIDFICPDIATPVRETGGGIVEVNAAPGFRMHTHPTEGEPQYVAKPVIDLLFPPGTPARIPILAVTGTNGKTTTVRMIAHILKLMGRRVGMTSTDGIVIDGRLMKRGDMSGPKSAQMVLQNPTVDTAVFEVARGGILREGLGYDRNDVAVVTNVTGDHLGLGGIDTLGQLANVKGVLVESVPRSGGRGPRTPTTRSCTGWAATAPGASSCSRWRRRRARTASTASTGTRRAATRRSASRTRPQGELIVLKHGPRKMPVLYTHLIPAHVRRPGADERRQRAGRGGRGVGVGRAPARHPPGPADVHDVVLPGARAAQPARGRGHARGHRLLPQRRRHAPAVRLREPDDGRAADAVRRARGGRRRRRAPARTGRAIGVIGIPGDRRDDDQREYGALAGGAFDEIIHPRGREPARPAAGRDGDQRRGGREGGEGRGPGPHDEGREGARGGGGGPGGAATRGAGRPRGGVRRRRGGRVPGGDDARRVATQGGTAFADPGELEAPDG